MWDGSQKGENPSERGKNKIQWITDLPAGLRGRVIFGKGNRMEELIKRLERVMQTGAPDKDGMHPISAEAVLEVVKELSEHGTNLASLGTDLISRPAAISAICNACGKIDCDKMDKCEKLQLPPANCSEFPNNSDTISRQAAIDALCNDYCGGHQDCKYYPNCENLRSVQKLPSAQPDIIRCRNCKFASGDSRICMKFDHSPIGELDFCSFAERREVNHESN